MPYSEGYKPYRDARDLPGDADHIPLELNNRFGLNGSFGPAETKNARALADEEAH